MAGWRVAGSEWLEDRALGTGLKPQTTESAPALRPAAGSLPPSAASGCQLAPQQLVDLGRVRLAARRLHHLPDEKAEQLVLAGAVIGELLRIRRHHLVDHPFDRAAVGNLLQAPRLDDLVSRTDTVLPYDRIIGLGWNGPYLDTVSTDWRTDAWGVDYVYDPIARTITSIGSGTDIRIGL